jgi:hypothetical protein
MDRLNGGSGPAPGEPPPYPGAPRWVILFAVAAAAFVVFMLARHLAGGGMAGHTH